jgi:hypothetical protein
MSIQNGNGVDMDMLTEFASLDIQLKELESKMKSIKNAKAKLEEPLLTQMTNSGINSMSLEGLGTLYIRSQIWPKFKDGMTRADVVKAMKLDGISEDFLKEDYNGQSFAAYIREIEQAGELLPEHLSKVVEPSEKFNLVRLK